MFTKNYNCLCLNIIYLKQFLMIDYLMLKSCNQATHTRLLHSKYNANASVLMQVNILIRPGELRVSKACYIVKKIKNVCTYFNLASNMIIKNQSKHIYCKTSSSLQNFIIDRLIIRTNLSQSNAKKYIKWF